MLKLFALELNNAQQGLGRDFIHLNDL